MMSDQRSGGSLPSLKPGEILGAGALAGRARLSALAAGGAFGFKFETVSDLVAASNLASAARSGCRRGAWGSLSSSIARRIAAVTAASSSSGRSIVGTPGQ
jgi:hypothetical protein